MDLQLGHLRSLFGRPHRAWAEESNSCVHDRVQVALDVNFFSTPAASSSEHHALVSPIESTSGKVLNALGTKQSCEVFLCCSDPRNLRVEARPSSTDDAIGRQRCFFQERFQFLQPIVPQRLLRISPPSQNFSRHLALNFVGRSVEASRNWSTARFSERSFCWDAFLSLVQRCCRREIVRTC